MTLDALMAIEQRLSKALADEAEAFLARCYYSTELKDANSPRRKPEPGMLLEAANDFGLTPEAHRLCRRFSDGYSGGPRRRGGADDFAALRRD